MHRLTHWDTDSWRLRAGEGTGTHAGVVTFPIDKEKILHLYRWRSRMFCQIPCIGPTRCHEKLLADQEDGEGAARSGLATGFFLDYVTRRMQSSQRIHFISPSSWDVAKDPVRIHGSVVTFYFCSPEQIHILIDDLCTTCRNRSEISWSLAHGVSRFAHGLLTAARTTILHKFLSADVQNVWFVTMCRSFVHTNCLFGQVWITFWVWIDITNHICMANWSKRLLPFKLSLVPFAFSGNLASEQIELAPKLHQHESQVDNGLRSEE